MTIDYGTGDKQYVSLPKVGEKPKEYEVGVARKVEIPKHRCNFTKREVKNVEGQEVTLEVDQGFHYQYEMKDGSILTIGSWKPFYAFREAKVNDGDTIRVHHPAKGEWKVEVLKRNDKQVAWDEDL